MFAFFDTIVSFLETIWTLVTNFVQSLILILEVVLSATTLPLIVTPFLPAVLLSSLVIVLGFAVVKFILAR